MKNLLWLHSWRWRVSWPYFEIITPLFCAVRAPFSPVRTDPSPYWLLAFVCLPMRIKSRESVWLLDWERGR